MRAIHGDRQELSRIRLERDIDNNIPSPPSMSSDTRPDDDDDVSSVDFARHNSHQHPSFHSFEHPSHLDSDFYSRHGDDDSIALDPDLGHTMSTAAHHASALTLSAGLHGRNSYNHTTGRASPSGVEYDPDRPLQAMLDNKIAEGVSLFDATTRSKTKSIKGLKNDQTRSLPTFDPVIVDSTAELDRFLRTGHHRPVVPRSGLSYPYISRSHSQPDPSASDASDSDASTPRLSQALGRHFSPKRPRSAPAPRSTPLPRPANPTPAHTMIGHPLKPETAKPKPGSSNLNLTKAQSKRATMEDASQGSHFSKHTRGLARDIEAQSRLSHDHEKEKENEKDATPRSRRRGIFSSAPVHANAFPATREPPPAKRPPFSDIVNKEHGDAKRRQHTSARVHLPDVTGLTSVVQSPVKGGVGYMSADAAHPSLAVDLLPALDALQTRLQALERENGVSRRRVRELELELEECKAEVVKERTRVRERERERDDVRLWEKERERERQVRGKMREEEGRYREVVEEKKALEALITTLRSHLARLTSELASHKSLIADLQADAYTVGETHAEVEALRAEVERLAGEVERLKEVVEEGLRERRRAREGSDVNLTVTASTRDEDAVPAQVGIDLTYVTVLGAASHVEEQEAPVTVEDLEPEEREPEYEPEELEPVSSRTRRYIQAVELVRVESEMRERRSERSLSRSKCNSSAKSQDNDSGNGSSLHEVEPTSADVDLSLASNAPRPGVKSTRLHSSDRPAGASRQRNVTPPKQSVSSTPFPQIRGSRMERLFFSAPEHNARTCTVCHRRKRSGEQRRAHQDEDEGFSEDEDVVRTYLKNKAQRAKGQERRGDAEDGVDNDRLPPQTVLARVVRELEDDFSHYKAIYLELAHQYGIMDAASNVAKRNVLADHLRDVIDTLEQKGDQIASLYELLNFQDQPLPRVPPPNLKHAVFA